MHESLHVKIKEKFKTLQTAGFKESWKINWYPEGKINEAS